MHAWQCVADAGNHTACPAFFDAEVLSLGTATISGPALLKPVEGCNLLPDNVTVAAVPQVRFGLNTC